MNRPMSKLIFTFPKIQLCISLLVVAIFLVSCNIRTDNKINSSKDSLDSTGLMERQNTSLDSVVYFLLEASAKDFHDNQVPAPVDFRNVQVKYLPGSKKENIYLICGEFLVKDNQDKAEWTSFTTIKTDPYEQWIGSSALTYCREAKKLPYKLNDLSSALKNRLDSVQKINNSTK